MTCERCGCLVDPERRQFHDDWHRWLNDKLAGRFVTLSDE